MMKHPRWFLLAAVFVALAQIGTLIWMIAGRAAILRDGPVIVLAVEPVGPQNFLRGGYLRLNYAISRIEQSLFDDDAFAVEDFDRDTVFFVQLSEDVEGTWQPVAATLGKPSEEHVSEGNVILRGNLRHMTGEGTILINYGIERFYVPRDERGPFEEFDMAEDLRVHVAVGRDGAAQIKSLHAGDRMLFSEPIF